ncbi:MAG: outer membrane protein assembly factor BamA [Porphyromonadaceae bacterium]|nr:outer membrane protein assembly factor BamA [Porphyromonadaceae bacterium]
MRYTSLLLFFFLFVSGVTISAQTNTTDNDTTAIQDTPQLDFAFPKQYTIADIKVIGAEQYEDFTLIGFSGLSIGQKITLPSPPGVEITQAVKKFWEQSMFSQVSIDYSKITNDSVWLNINLRMRPKVSEVNFEGLKKNEVDDLKLRIGIEKDKQITPNMADRAKIEIKRYLDEKGFANADINIYQKDDPAIPNQVIVDVNVDKKEKTKVRKIIVYGNENLTDVQIDKAMKKTNDNKIQNIFRSKKFIQEEYENDKISVVELYNQHGFRDAYIVSDSIVQVDAKSVDVHITVEEGDKYYFGDITWIGNTLYPYEYLNEKLGIKKGDIYNHKLLMDRLNTDEDAIMKDYQNYGYLFSQVLPVEASIENDTINYELRLHEGKPATINEIHIKGNTRVYENVVRRELFTKPGKLYSQQDIIRSLQYLAQMQHFDQEKLYKDISNGIHPNEDNGTVDITYQLETKSSDQIEFSAGWGAAGLVGSVGLKFTNFAIQNLFRPEAYRFVPQGEGQTFTIDARTNGNYYSSFSLSFLEPWLGGKRPNSLSMGLYYSAASGMSSRYLESLSNMYSGYGYSPYGYGGMYGGRYGGMYNNSYETEVDKNKYFRTLGGSIGYGKRLKWPDTYFTFYGELAYQRYMISNWYQYETNVTNGVFNNFSVNLTLGRNSTDNPLFTRYGSAFSLGLQFTPPYSLLNNGKIKGKSYSDPTLSDADRYKWIEYHKWKFSAKTFTPLMAIDKTPVLMTRAEFAYVGHYNQNARTPFGTYMFGGDGMTGYGGYANEYVSMRGYETGRLTPIEYDKNGVAVRQIGYLYNKFTLELRYPISLEQSATIWALGFLEAGNSFNKIADYNPFNLKRAAGVGVRIVLPMFGLMGIDWGYGFDPQVNESKAHGSQFHFVIGKEL